METKKIESDRITISFYKEYFSNKDYNENKKCSQGCGRSIKGCRCIDKAFGY